MKKVKLNTCGIKYTPSTFITYYEVNSNFTISDEQELLTLEEVKAVLNSHEPIITHSADQWNIAITTPLSELYRQSKRF